MINLAGIKDADITIREELYLAGIEAIPMEGKGEVPFTVCGRIGHWKLERAWYYWIASTEHLTDGLLLNDAMRLHYKPHPIECKILGTIIRSNGYLSGESHIDYTINGFDIYEFCTKTNKYLGYKGCEEDERRGWQKLDGRY